MWAAGFQALHGEAASVYDPTEHTRIQDLLVVTGQFFYSIWPYPPTFFFILAPLAILPYIAAFLSWDLVTLVGCSAVVYVIVRQRAAIALVLASPFTAWNILAGQNGLLTAALLGAALLFLEWRPVLAGVFIGCLTYKPQFGVLLPVALVAAGQWRAIASAAVTALGLAGIAIAVFGSGLWAAFPRGLAAQTSLNLFAGPDSNWGYLQTVYGLIRALHGTARLAWFAQGTTALCLAILVWLVWRSRTRYALKAATLSAAALIATPYAFAYDMAAIAIPAAFLARDQISCGLLRGEQTIALALFGATLALLVAFGDRAGGLTFGSTPVGPPAVITLLAVILRRVLCGGASSADFATDEAAVSGAVWGRAKGGAYGTAGGA